MSLKSLISDWRRRRDGADVRVDRAVQELPQPVRHRAPARGAGPALHQVQAEAPIEPRMRPRDALSIPPVALENLAAERDRLLGWAADDETNGRDLLTRAARYRAIAAGYEKLLELPQLLVFGYGDRYAEGAQVPPDDDPRPSLEFCRDCGSTVYVALCRDSGGDLVPLCRDCHQGPHLDQADTVDPVPAGQCCTYAAVNGKPCPECSTAPEGEAEWMAEPLAAGPATVPGHYVGFAATVEIPNGWWSPGDILNDLERVDGVER